MSNKLKLIFPVLLVFSMFTAFACSCAEIDKTLGRKIARQFKQSDLIFTGNVVQIEKISQETHQSSSDPVIYTFEVIQNIKGEMKHEIVEILSEQDGASCGYVFQKGQDYLVYSINSNHFSARTGRKSDSCDRVLL